MSELGPDICVRALCGTGFRAQMPWAYWEQVGGLKFVPDVYSPADPCSSKPTGGVLSLPQDQSSAHTCQSINYSCTGESPGRREGLTTEKERSRCSKFLSPSFLEEGGGGGEPGNLCATGVCLFALPEGEALHSSLTSVWVHMVSHSAFEGIETHLFLWKCPLQEKAGGK